MRMETTLSRRAYLFALAISGSWAASQPFPPPAQVSRALVSGGAGVGNNPVAVALGDLVSNPADLAQALANGASALLGTLGDIVNPELRYSYGQSPPVYPSPQGNGTGAWEEAYNQARSMVAQMTDDEKNTLTYGVTSNNGCSGLSGAVSRLEFPGICFQDAESGVRSANLVNGYPSQISVGASWNRSLAYQRAYYIGREFKAKGANVVNGPVVSPLGRLAKGGRNFEGFSNDPYLSGALVGPTVEGLQESVISAVKHFIAYEQETNRTPFLMGLVPDLFTQSVSSNVDDKTMHEVYLWPFYDAIKAGAGSVMCSYNRVNNSYACQNSKILNGLLKTELGFQGFVLSDWYGQHTGIASANSGLDMVMPVSQYFDNNQLATAVRNGSVASSRLNDMATRILAAWYRFAPFSTPGLNSYTDVDARDPAADPTIFQSAVEGHVMVKNTNGALPFSKPKMLSLFGFDALGGRNTSSDAPIVFPYGLANTPNYTDGTAFTAAQFLLFNVETLPYGAAGPEVALAGTILGGGGSGAITPTSSISPADAFNRQAALDGTVLQTDFYSLDPSVNSSTDACLVFINEQSSESWDRPGLADPYADTLVNNVASKCNNTIVIIHNAGLRIVDEWITNPNVTGVIFGHLPGQSSGDALVEIIYGRQSPSGRLPYTLAQTASDFGPLLNPAGPTTKNPQFPQSDFTEGVAIDYKYFIQNQIAPRYPFGFGLTYTNFTYSNLAISKNASVDTSPLPPGYLGNSSQVAPEGGISSLYDIIATATASVTNTGNMTAAEVAQLYIGIPQGVPKQLRGFDKQSIAPGQTIQYSFPLRRRDLSSWDVASQQWILQAGTYQIMVGKDVMDIQLQGVLSI